LTAESSTEGITATTSITEGTVYLSTMVSFL